MELEEIPKRLQRIENFIQNLCKHKDAHEISKDSVMGSLVECWECGFKGWMQKQEKTSP